MRVVLDKVSFQYESSRPLLSELSAVIPAGEIAVVTGPSGSGKSTLFLLVAGWRPPTSGAIEWHGVQRLQWVLQGSVGAPRRTVLDNVCLPMLARGIARSEASKEAIQLLDRFGLLDRAASPYSALSGGEGQRLMLARALAASPDLLLVDEPTAQLDRASAATVISVLDNLASENRIVLVATHDPTVVARGTLHLALGDFDVGRTT